MANLFLLGCREPSPPAMVVAPWGYRRVPGRYRIALGAIADRDDDQPVVGQRRPGRGNGFVPGHRRYRLSSIRWRFCHTGAGRPQTASLIEESTHLTGHVPKRVRNCKDNGVILTCQLLRRGDGRVLRSACFGRIRFSRHGFRHALHNHLNRPPGSSHRRRREP